MKQGYDGRDKKRPSLGVPHLRCLTRGRGKLKNPAPRASLPARPFTLPDKTSSGESTAGGDQDPKALASDLEEGSLG